MFRPRTVADVIPTRRELLKYGGLGLVGASIEGIRAPRARAANIGTKVQPRGTAKNVIFYEISGAISHLDTFDFKDNPAVPKDSKVEKLPTGIYFPVNFLPRIAKIMPQVAMLRSFVTHDEVHLRGQHYVQAGKQLSVAFSREIPSIGSVVAYELESRRRESDTFPTYVSFNLETNQVGALSTGFLPPQYSVFDLNAQQALTGMTLDEKAVELVEERWRILQGFRDISRERLKSFGRNVHAFDDFSITAKKLLTDPRWPAAFKVSEEDKKRYGNTGPGLACALARNVLRENGGTRYIHVCQHGWDHHKYIWDRTKSDNHYNLMADFDPALASLIEDLAVTPS